MKTVNDKYLKVLAKKCRYDIVRMISHAGSGHIGGSLSSVDIYVFLKTMMDKHDRLVISHGHSAAAIYAVLGNMGYFDVEEAVSSFRQAAPYEGHPSTYIKGIEWCSGSLGQGLSVGCGFALAKKLKNEPGTVYVVMGDGEQQKGQLQEAREFAVKYKLDNLVAIIDLNGLQASGKTTDISGQMIGNKYAMSGWEVKPVCGHDFNQLRQAVGNITQPTCLLASTVMGKGIPEIENNYQFHGTVIDEQLKELSLDRFRLSEDELTILQQGVGSTEFIRYPYPQLPYKKSTPYAIGDMVDVRSGMGRALAESVAEFPDVPFAALDCDLEGSLKLSGLKSNRPEAFIECGIAEHNAATVAAALAKSGIVAFHADFSVFNIAETYGQNRMADMNKSPVKLIATHAGLDVGEDGKTHQCIEYVSLLSNLFGFQVILPADANQAVSAVRYAISVDKAVAIIGGRSKVPVLCDEHGNKLDFDYGKAQWLKRGKDGVILSYGNMVHRAVTVAEKLAENGLDIGVLNISTPLDFDEKEVLEAAKTGLIVTYEDHNVRNGMGSHIARFLCENGVHCTFLAKGVSQYGSSMPPDRLYEDQRLDEESMVSDILKINQKRRHDHGKG